ncbi:MAG: methyltransferase domain-containing protein [Candidatus Solibacter usitatus]|nr:methyltransferase domain-containing protein [Candidatus Solibacter usitatus]
MFSILFYLAAFAPQTQHQQHPPRDAAEYAKVLESPDRDAWQKPHEVITALTLRADEVIADLGAGSGYFTRRFAHHAKLVYAVDIDAKLLAMVDKMGAKNVKTVLASLDDPKLPAASVDTIFICDVLHHIEQRPSYYAKLARALKPGGRVVIVDFYKRKLPVGPPESMKLSEDQVAAEFAAAGFRKTQSFDFLPHQYYLVFSR